MNRRQQEIFRKCLHKIALGNPSTLSDEELIDRYVTQRDDAAFELLVQRYGPLVQRLCRRALPTGGNADDIFQATFLLLARKAATLKDRKAVGPWLHGVAIHLAAKANRSAARRHMHEMCAGLALAMKNEPDETVGDHIRELRALVDQELAQLPDKCRQPLILCYLEGKTQAEAAHQLGIPRTTLERRVEKGLKLLQTRLKHLGGEFVPTLTLVAILGGPADAAVSRLLVVETVRNAMRFAQGLTASGAAAAVAALANEGLATMPSTALVFAHLKVVLTAILIGAAGVGSAIVAGLASGKPSNLEAESAGITTSEIPGSKFHISTRESTVEVERKPKVPRFDDFGDPLPEGAIGRIGTLRLRSGRGVAAMAMAADRPIVAAIVPISFGVDGPRGKVVCFWNTTSGKQVARFSLAEKLYALACSADAKTFAVGGESGLIHLLDASSGREIRQFAVRESEPKVIPIGYGIRGLQFGPRDEWLLSWGQDGTVRRWDPTTGRQLGRFGDGDCRVYQVALSPDGRQLAVWMGLSVRIWDVNTGEERCRFRVFDQLHHCLAFLPDGKTLAAVSNMHGVSGKVVRWDIVAGKEEVGPVAEFQGEILSVAFSPDGKTLATSWPDRTIRFLDVTSGKESRRVGPLDGSAFWQLMYTRDGAALASSGLYESCVRLWDTATGRELIGLDVAGAGITTVAYSPTGKVLAISSGAAIRIYELSARRLLSTLVLHDDGVGGSRFNKVAAALFSWDGKFLIFADDNSVRFWDVESGRESRRIAVRDLPRQLALSPDGAILAVTSQDSIRLLDVVTGHELRELRGWSPKSPANCGSFVAFSPDGKTLVASSRGQSILYRWDVATGLQLLPSFDDHDGGVTAAAFSLDGRRVATATTAGSVYYWETATAQVRWIVKDQGDATALALSPDSRFLAMGHVRFPAGVRDFDRDVLSPLEENHLQIRLLDVKDGKVVHSFDGGHLGIVRNLVFSPDGKTLASGSEDTTVFLWDVRQESGIRNQGAGAQAMFRRGELETLWVNLKGNAASAQAGMVKLAAAPEQAIPFLKARLHPVAVPDAQLVARLLGELRDYASYDERQKALGGLREIADGAVPALKRVLKDQPSAEVRRWINELFEDLNRTVLAGNRLREERMLEVLEHIGNQEAKRLLQELAAGAPEARLTRGAQATLVRLTRRE